MSESNPDRSNPSSGENVKAPNIFERAKEEIEAIIHTAKSPHQHEETHGMRDDIDENTPLNDVHAPNVFERAKEEIEALVQTIHSKKESQNNGIRDESIKAKLETDFLSGNDAKASNLIERAKVEVGAILHPQKSPLHHHNNETHGRSNDIDKNTPIDEVKAPNVFERAKEELEALVETIHPKKDSDSSPKKAGGFGSLIGRWLEKVCRPWGTKKD